MSINPRSGSTFLSELLSSSPRSSLWYEPLKYLYEEPAPQTFITKTSKRKTSKPEKTISETKASFFFFQGKTKFLRTKNLNKKSDGGGWYFYGINRHTAFNYNHWKEEMSPKFLEAIEQDLVCQEAIIMSNYTLLT